MAAILDLARDIALCVPLAFLIEPVLVYERPLSCEDGAIDFCLTGFFIKVGMVTMVDDDWLSC